MSKIVYLFGAGASIGALPIVETMPEWIDKLIQDLLREDLQLSDKDSFDRPDFIKVRTKRDFQDEFINDLKWMRDASARHISIDTFAKKLYIKNDYDNLNRLKIALSAYFVLEQIRHPPDKRYDFFFASIMDSVHRFPDDIRILSWNYDSQFEIAYSEFSNDNRIYQNQRLLNIHVKNKSIDPNELNVFGIYKLNGSTEIFSTSEGNQTAYYLNLEANPSLSIETMEILIRMYATSKLAADLMSGFSFAWEPSNYQHFLDNVKKDTEDAEILIVIGYSFPFFNRTMDRDIIANMKNLTRVHFLDPKAQNIITRFKSIRNNWGVLQLIPEDDYRYFFIPDELSR